MNKKSETQARYDAANTIQVKIKLNTKTDADILSQLAQKESKQGYIKALIRADIAASKTGEKAEV